MAFNNSSRSLDIQLTPPITTTSWLDLPSSSQDRIIPPFKQASSSASAASIEQTIELGHSTTISAAAHESPAAAAPFKPSSRFILAFISILVITLAAALDATSLSVALPLIADDIHGTALEAFWAGTSFLITSAVFQPVLAGLSHVFGRKSCLLGSGVLFVIGSILAAVAPNFRYMLAGRSIQGIGGGGILVLGEVIITDLVPLATRGTYMGLLGCVWALGAVTGPLMGGAFAEFTTWRWIFWINLPICGLGFLVIVLFLKLDRLPGSLWLKVRSFDWIGSVLLVGASLSCLIPLTWGGVMFEWSSWRTLFPMILGLVSLVGFGYYEHVLGNKICRPAVSHDNQVIIVEPIMKSGLFGTWTLIILYVETILHGIILWSLLYFLPIYYEACKLYSPIITGVAILPESGLVAPVSVIAAFAITKMGRYRMVLWTGWFFTALGAGLLFLLQPDTPIYGWVLLNVLVSIGTGILFPSMALAIQAACLPADSGHAAALFSFLRVVGQALGLAISGVAFQNRLFSSVAANDAFADRAAKYSSDATALVSIIQGMPDGSPDKDFLRGAVSDSLKVIWLLMTVIGAVGLVSSLFTREYTLTQEHDTKQGLVEKRDTTR